nr:hypothetical protein [Mesorhizobium sp.]
MIKKAELRAEQVQMALAEQWLSARPPHAGMELDQALPLLQSDTPVRNEEIAGMFALTVAEARATAADSSAVPAPLASLHISHKTTAG